MGIVETMALTLGASWASGINLYAAISTLGLMGVLGWLDLPAQWQVLQNPLVIGVAVILYLVEFGIDKVPGLDTFWDGLHTFLRIPAAALLAYSAAADAGPVLGLAAGLVGGTLGTANHAAKAGLRLAINTSPEPFSNTAASLGEDGLVFGGLALAAAHPALFLAALVLWLVLLAWLLPKVWRFLRSAYRRLATRPVGR